MKKRYIIAGFFLLTGVVIWGLNSSHLVPSYYKNDPLLLAHRGVHQNFDMTGVENDTCTATQILPPTHNYLENTLPSIQAALDYGADIVEVDVHPTTDGEFAVFHDWTLDCRTNGTGRVRDHSSEELRKLDIGYGYSFDGGQSFPFRGKHVGQMPMLSDVINRFPTTHFLINFKSRSSDEGRLLMQYLSARDWSDNFFGVYGHQNPINAARQENPNLKTMGKRQVKNCLTTYVAVGWSGYVPKACRNSLVPVPENYAHLMWGWPARFKRRMNKYESGVILMGPHTKARSEPAIDSLEQLDAIHKNFSGIIWTNKIEVIGPHVKETRNSSLAKD